MICLDNWSSRLISIVSYKYSTLHEIGGRGYIFVLALGCERGVFFPFYYPIVNFFNPCFRVLYSWPGRVCIDFT